MKNSLVLLALAVGFTFTSCSKDDDAAQTKTQMLTGKNWKVTAATVSVDNAPAKDFFGQVPDCSKDDFTNYAADGKVTFDVGATKCAANEAQTQSGTWTFTDNETKLSVTQDNDPTVYTISELTSSKLVLSATETFTNGGQTNTFQYVTTFEAK